MLLKFNKQFLKLVSILSSYQWNYGNWSQSRDDLAKNVEKGYTQL